MIEEILRRASPSHSLCILHSRLERINFWLLLAAVWSRCFARNTGLGLLTGYFEHFIRFTRPKLVVTFTDNDLRFWELGQRLSGFTKFAAIQNGRRGRPGDIFEFETYVGRVDLLLAFSDEMCKRYTAISSVAKSVSIGSLRSNFVKLSPCSNQNEMTVLFVSSFIPDSGSCFRVKFQEKSWDHSDWFEPERRALRDLAELCRIKNLRLHVGMRHAVTDQGYSAELEWIMSTCMDSTVIPVPSLGPLSIYNLVDRFNVVVTVDSTVGLEALSRGKRVLHAAYRSAALGEPSLSLAWGCNLAPEELRWLEVTSRDDLNFAFTNALGQGDPDYIRLLERAANQLCSRDEGNLLAVELFREIMES